MASLADEIVPRRWMAPRGNGQVLLDPPEGDWPDLWRQNQEAISSYSGLVRQWRSQARTELVRAARDYTAQYRDIPAAAGLAEPLVMSGHQPTLFHPGVWFKSFVLDDWVRRFHTTGIQLIIDNDVMRPTAIRVPSGTIQQPDVAYIEFDRPGRIIPIESTSITDAAAFHSFGERVSKSLRPFGYEALIDRFWPEVLRWYPQFQNTGQALAAARHSLEARHGLDSLELPLSTVCKTATFHEFVGHLLSHASEFASAHNSCLAEFRRVRRLRSENHPVPNLTVAREEVEAPFWIWPKNAPVRRRLYVRRSGSSCVLSDHDRFERRLSASDSLPEQLGALESEGFAIRPRALITTMYARLILGDVFLHGIGGATYDLVGDAIMRDFFRLNPPRFVTATATMHLPIPCADAEPGDLAQIDAALRDMQFHPERYLESVEPSVIQWVDEKREWISRGSLNGSLKPRHDAIQRLNQHMLGRLTDRFEVLQRRRQQVVNDLHRKKIVASREFAFVLHPPALIDLLKEASSPDKANPKR